jgi:hypothetical protein
MTAESQADRSIAPKYAGSSGLSFGPDEYGTRTIQNPIEQAATETCSALCTGGGGPARASKDGPSVAGI